MCYYIAVAVDVALVILSVFKQIGRGRGLEKKKRIDGGLLWGRLMVIQWVPGVAHCFIINIIRLKRVYCNCVCISQPLHLTSRPHH